MRIAVLVFLVAAFLILSGCCSYFDDIIKKNQTNTTTNTSVIPVNKPPFVNLSLNKTEGPTPFNLVYTYQCYDPDNNLLSCELKLDNKTYAKGTNQSNLFPKNYTRPDFYYTVLKQIGNHTLEIFAIDKDGLNASKIIKFTILKGDWLTKSGWYTCNNYPNNPPCDSVIAGYCDKFNPQDLAVRQAAAEAIAKHPGAFSLNQLLDVYDWVHANIFYQNVPIDLWPPYPPNQTLATKSGDCKNQAVLIASMVEAIGGSARVLYVPDCRHAFTEVYVGNDEDANILSSAVWAHYSGKLTNEEYQSIRWHTSKNAKNETENWFVFDNAGGWFPGITIKECLNASQTFVIYDCNRDINDLNAPEVKGTAYGPYTRLDEIQVIQPEWSYSWGIEPWLITVPAYEWCHYKLMVESRSVNPVDWYVIGKNWYQAFKDYKSFNYYYGEEQVKNSTYEFDWSKSEKFYIGLRNSNDKTSITVRTQLFETCYK